MGVCALLEAVLEFIIKAVVSTAEDAASWRGLPAGSVWFASSS